MGCVFVSPAEQVKGQQQAIKSAFKQNAPEPYITATGQISVPVTMMTGEWSRTYPVWIDDWGVTRHEYSAIIETLEKATKPLASSLWDAQTQAVTNIQFSMNMRSAHQNQMQNINTMMAGAAKWQQMPQVIESTLYGLNHTVFEPKGLQALSSSQ